MLTCICSSCKNLKSVIDENDDANSIMETCDYDFPSEACSDCGLDGCELTCDHYIDDQEDEAYVITKCRGCGTQLKVAPRNDSATEAYCVSCYLSKK